MNVTYLRGALLAAIACTLVGASFTANSVLGDYPYAGGQALRYGLAGLLLLPLLRRGGAPAPAATLRTLSGRQWARLALLAAVGMVGFNLAVLAAERSAEPAVPGVFVGCAPILVAVLVPLLDGRRPARAVLYAAALVAAGAFTVQGWGRTDTAGIVCSVGALAGEVGFAVIAVPVLRPLGPKLLSATVCVIAAAESAALGLVLDGGGFLRVPSPGETAALLWQAAVVTVVGFVCWYMGMQRIGAERATLFSGLIPVSAALTAPLVGTGSYGLGQAAGSCLVGLGVALGSGVLHRRRPGTDSAAGVGKHPGDESRAVVHRDPVAARQPDRPGAGDGVLGPDALAAQEQPVAAAPRDGHRRPRHTIGEQDIASGGQRLVEPGASTTTTAR
ncbi:DMT family transporter [Streptomyces sp. NPDC048669]|uniref:DMT family transporter n=1 Tax=Streptomyces sp. NPDC048669 TaxID=3155267 RepID=UPI003438E961